MVQFDRKVFRLSACLKVMMDIFVFEDDLISNDNPATLISLFGSLASRPCSWI